MKQPVLAVVGPTAVGKTRLGIELAHKYNGEIISGDSMQVYEGLTIGTAKPTPGERREAPHHLVDMLSPDMPYSAADFKAKAEPIIERLHGEGKLPIIVGGTGMYIRALLHDYSFYDAKKQEDVREKWELYARQYGSEALHANLARRDPERAAAIHPNNVRKVVRALEILETSEEGPTLSKKMQKKHSPYASFMIGLTMNRPYLYERIERRVDRMMADGLEHEARWLYERFGEEVQAAQAIGYKEWFPYFRGDESADWVAERMKRNSRRYAKRQLTWFRNKEDAHWYDITDRSRPFADEAFASILRQFEREHR